MTNKSAWSVVAIVGMLTAGCGGGLDLKPAANPSARLQGQGFTVLPPPGSDWYIAEAIKDGIQFVKLQPGQKSDPDDAPHTFSVGVFPLPANGRCQVRCRIFSFDFVSIPAFSDGRICPD